MKKILISVDDDIVEILEKTENKSAYIRKAILAEQDNNLTQEVRRLAMLVDGQVDDIQSIIEAITTVKQSIANHQVNTSLSQPTAYSTISSYPKEFVPRPPDPEKGYPCCTKSTPCKHWVWDNVDTVWKNTITGLTRDA